MSLRGGVLAPNGKVVFVPFYRHQIGVFDPATFEFKVVAISHPPETPPGYWGGVLAPSGKV
ncbi:hypothetical protein T484DRAFT_1856146 [Baffinella frigidus]|nr:hypothetical protein T484DRAFT_1856146 [Cryptophyta sp. CCMP2293]